MVVKWRVVQKAAEYRFGSWKNAIEHSGITYEHVTDDRTNTIRAGYLFEELIANILNDLKIEYKKQQTVMINNQLLRPDFIVEKNHWIDAKLSEWTDDINETIQKYEPHSEKLTIVCFRMYENVTEQSRKINKKTNLLSYRKILNQLPADKQRRHDEHIFKIENLLKKENDFNERARTTSTI